MTDWTEQERDVYRTRWHAASEALNMIAGALTVPPVDEVTGRLISKWITDYHQTSERLPLDGGGACRGAR